MGVPFKVLFLCKNCGHAIEEFDLFMLHKQKYHLLEFEKIKCIVFEENITFRPDSPDPDERNPMPIIISNNDLQQEQDTDFTQLFQDLHQPDHDQDQPFNATPADQSNDVELLNSVIADSHSQPSTVTAIANFPCADPCMDIDENENFKATAAPEPKLSDSTAVSKDEQQTDEEFSDESLDDDYDSDESDPDGGFYMSDISDSDLAFESEFAQLETELKEIDSSSQNTSSLLPNMKIDGATATNTGTGTGTGVTTNNTKNKAIDNKVAQSTTSFVKIPSENPTDPQYNKFECQQQNCVKKFSTEEEPPFMTTLESHQSKIHQTQNQNQEQQQNSAKIILCKFKCEFCGEFFRLQHFLNRHIALIHSTSSSHSLSMIDDQPNKVLNNSRCSQQNCSLTFQTASELLAHENLHKIIATPTATATAPATSQGEAETLYLCCENDCDKIFNTSSTFEAHIKFEHGDINCPPLFTCKFCQKSFKLESNLKIHCAVHEKPFTCPLKGCNASFKNKRYLRQHERAHLSPGRRRQRRLLQSLQSPPGPEPEVQVHQSSPNATNPKGDSGSFICEVCGRGFSQFFYLTRHLVKHSKDRPFNCPHPTCDRFFKTTAAVKLHCQRGHGDDSDSRKIKCLHPSCSEGFKTQRALKDHLETEHHGYRPYRCQHNDCDKSFIHPVSYKRHLLSKHKGSSG